MPFELPASLWGAIARIERVAWPPREADAASFALAVDRHRLLAIAARDEGAGLPEAVRAAVVARDREGSPAREAAAREQADWLARLRDRLPFQWLCVKGADYYLRVYPSLSARPMNDIDLLVPRARFGEAVRQLLDDGCVRLPGHPSTTEVALRIPASALWIDVYDRFAHDTRASIDEPEIWSESARGTDGLLRMAPHHALAIHTVLVANVQFVTHVRKLLDLWLLAQDPDVVRRAIACARRWRTERAFYASFHVMRRLLPEAGEAPWAGEIETLGTPQGRAALHRLVAAGAPFAALPPRMTQIRRKLLLIDTAAHRTRFVTAQMRARLLAGRAAQG